MAASGTSIVLVEDDEADILHFQRLCKKCDIQAEIKVETSGDDALELLRQRASNDDERQLIVTDLNMPGLSGHELIEEIREDERLASSVIFVVSTSDLEDDINRAYHQHVAGYIVKDQSGERLEDGIFMLRKFLQAVTLR